MILIRTTEDDRNEDYLPINRGNLQYIHHEHGRQNIAIAFCTDPQHRISVRAAQVVNTLGVARTFFYSIIPTDIDPLNRFRLRHNIESGYLTSLASKSNKAVHSFSYTPDGVTLIHGISASSFGGLYRMDNFFLGIEPLAEDCNVTAQLKLFLRLFQRSIVSTNPNICTSF